MRATRSIRAVLWGLLAAAVLAGTLALIGTGETGQGRPVSAVLALPIPAPTTTPTAPASPQTSPEASATPTASPSPTTPEGRGEPEEEDCGFTDFGCRATNAINGWFADLVDSASGPVFDVLGSSLFATPEIDAPQMAAVRGLWETSRTIANTCFVLLVTLAGVMLMTGQGMPGGTAPRDLAAGVVWAFLSANMSLVLIGYAIEFANGLSSAFLTEAESAIDPMRVARTISDGILAAVATQGIFIALVALVAVVLAVCVGFTYVLRLALTMCVIAAAPLALMFHALPVTSGLARLWWRGLAGLLAIQVCQSLVLAMAFRVLFARDGDDAHTAFFPDDTSALLDLLLIICLLFILVRIPGWVARTIWQAAQPPRLLTSMIKSFVLYRGIGALVRRGAHTSAVMAPKPPNRPNPPKPPKAGPKTPPPSPLPPGGPPPGPRPGPEDPRPSGGTPPTRPTLPTPAAAPANRDATRTLRLDRLDGTARKPGPAPRRGSPQPAGRPPGVPPTAPRRPAPARPGERARPRPPRAATRQPTPVPARPQERPSPRPPRAVRRPVPNPRPRGNRT